MGYGVEMRCPVCQASRTTAGELNCMTCGMTFAYVSLFANSYAFNEQNERILAQRARNEERSEGFRKKNRFVIGKSDIIHIMMPEKRMHSLLTGKITDGLDFCEDMTHLLKCDSDGHATVSGSNDWGETTIPVGGPFVRCYAAANVSYWLGEDGKIRICGKKLDSGDTIRSYDDVQDLAITQSRGKVAVLHKDGTVDMGEPFKPISNVTAIVAGRDFVLLLNHDGRVRVIPHSLYLDDTHTRAVKQVESLNHVVEIAADNTTIIALKADGRLSIVDVQGNHGFADAEQWQNIVAISAGFGLLLAIDEQRNYHFAGNHITRNLMRRLQNERFRIAQ